MIEYFKNFKQALETSGHETAMFMSSRLRSDARALGWPEEVAGNLHLKHSDGGFHVHAHESHKDKVLDLEYGTPTSQPTAAIRKFNNRYHEFDNFLIKRAGHHVGRA